MKTIILIAAHKPYAFPRDPVYYPIQCGAALHPRLPFPGDDAGENISGRNDVYCELTGLYWGWKQTASDALGLCHYRRYFVGKTGSKSPVAGAELEGILRETPVILPRKRHYWIETGEQQFIHAHGAFAMEAVREALRELCPEYLPAFERSLRARSGHRFNMFVMRRDLADQYCAWLFEVLFRTERAWKDGPPPRMMGYLGERLMDAWIETNRISYRELPVWNTENQHWGKKILKFLARKISYQFKFHRSETA